MDLKIDFLMAYDEKSVVAELRRIAKAIGKKTLSRDDIDRFGRLGSGTVIRKFGTLHKAHEVSGLVPGVFKKVTDRELLDILVALWKITAKKHGRSPTMDEVRRYGFPVSASTIAVRFGSWPKALMRALKLEAKRQPRKAAEADGAAKPKVIKAKRKSIPVKTRFLVFRRDEYTCRICGQKGGELQVDHVVPLARGGSDHERNMQTLCKDCNFGKGVNLEERGKKAVSRKVRKGAAKTQRKSPDRIRV